MILGIDASNIRQGGGVTHLCELLVSADPLRHGIESVRVWSCRRTLDRLPDRMWLEKIHHPALEAAALRRQIWQHEQFSSPRRAACDLLFVPGGSFIGAFHPYVAMSQNLLPFDLASRRCYGWSPKRWRLEILQRLQTRTFSRADGVVFLTDAARKTIAHVVGGDLRRAVVIPHGIEDSFRQAPRTPRPIELCSFAEPLRLVYVSIIETYKHQLEVASAVASLRAAGLPVVIDFVGPTGTPASVVLECAVKRLDPQNQFLRIRGPVRHDELSHVYFDAECFVFASSCENMPIILLEAMAAGLPIACSEIQPMSSMLGEAGVYFVPESPESIARALEMLIRDQALRARCARKAYTRALEYKWCKAAEDTFTFLSDVAVSNAGAVAIAQERHP